MEPKSEALSVLETGDMGPSVPFFVFLKIFSF